MLGRKPKEMRLPGGFLREILDHAHEGRPNEICGLIAGQGGQAVKLYRTTNDDPNPRVRFNVEPMELLDALREMEEKGWETPLHLPFSSRKRSLSLRHRRGAVPLRQRCLHNRLACIQGAAGARLYDRWRPGDGSRPHH